LSSKCFDFKNYNWLVLACCEIVLW
jgi:hypothetical protein